MKTAARAGVSFRAATVVAPVRTFKTTAIRKDEANKENSVHVVHYEKGQRREHDIEVDEAKLVIPAVQDVEIIVVSVAALELVTDKAGLRISGLPGNKEWRRCAGSLQRSSRRRYARSWRQSSRRMDVPEVNCA